MQNSVWTIVLLCLLGLGCGGAEKPSGISDRPLDIARLKDKAVGADVIQLLGKAQKAYRQERYTQAMAWTNKAIGKAPEQAAAYYLQGHIWMKRHKWANARQSFQKTLDLNRTYPEAWLSLGKTVYRQGKPRLALDYYERERKIATTPQLLVHVGQAHAALGQIKQAESLYQQAISRDTTYAEAYRWLGQLYEEQKQFQKALGPWKQAYELRPELNYYRYVVGTLYFKSNQMEEAVTHLKEVVQHHPSHVWTTIGRAHKKLGNLLEAQKAYRKALAADSGYADAYYWLSKTHSEAGNYKKALAAARQAQDLDSNQVAYTYNVGQLLVQTGQYDAAVTQLKTVVAQDAAHEGALFNLGQALNRQGKPAQAKRYMARVDSLQRQKDRLMKLETRASTQPDDPVRWHELGKAFEQAGRIDKAINAYQQASRLVPQNLALANNIANLTLVQGDTLQAVQVYQTILRKDSTVTPVWLNLGVVYANQGRVQKARRVWKQVLEYDPENQQVKAYLREL